MKPLRTHLASLHSLFAVACTAILLSGCLAVSPAPATAPTALIQAPTPDADMATHEALMADPAATPHTKRRCRPRRPWQPMRRRCMVHPPRFRSWPPRWR